MKNTPLSIMLLGALWLLSTPLVHAETLNYRVYFSGFYAGDLTFTHAVDDKKNYTIAANLKDKLPWVTFRDSIVASGKMKNKAYLTDTYDLTLHENDYRADKLISFDRKTNTARYTNRLDPTDTLAPVSITPATADALSVLWSLRTQNPDVFTTPQTLPIIGLKRPLNLTIETKGMETVKLKRPFVIDGFDDKTERLTRIDLTVRDPDNADKTTLWKLFVRTPKAGEALTPVALETKTKLGMFKAYLQDK